MHNRYIQQLHEASPDAGQQTAPGEDEAHPGHGVHDRRNTAPARHGRAVEDGLDGDVMNQVWLLGPVDPEQRPSGAQLLERIETASRHGHCEVAQPGIRQSLLPGVGAADDHHLDAVPLCLGGQRQAVREKEPAFVDHVDDLHRSIIRR